ncbi:MAG: RDD family protein [Anaerolineales bacterium]|nr:RDD family protein [Anaerolineales bacterium]
MSTPERTQPSIWRRIAAYLLDYFVLSVVLASLQGIIFLVGRGFPYNLLHTGLQIELWVFSSVSLPVWFYPGLRSGIIVVYVLIGIYIITMFLNQRRQSVHDLIARTIVVDTRKKENAR